MGGKEEEKKGWAVVGWWFVGLLKYTKYICSSPNPSLSKPQLSPPHPHQSQFPLIISWIK